jgi:hypothetical protein
MKFKRHSCSLKKLLAHTSMLGRAIDCLQSCRITPVRNGTLVRDLPWASITSDDQALSQICFFPLCDLKKGNCPPRAIYDIAALLEHLLDHNLLSQRPKTRLLLAANMM